MSETSKNKIYYNDNENSVADVLADMKKMAESTDKAIENSKYNDAQIKKDISDAKKEQALKDAEQDNKIIELQNEKAKLEKELKEAQEDFYQNSIRGQASGEYIHVEDSSNCRSIIGIGGNHEQETRSGKNYLNTLAKYKAGEKVTVDGITYIFNEDGSITCNGTATADSVLTFSSNLQTINGSGKKIVGMITGTQVPAKLSILAYTSDWSKNTFELLSSVNKNITINMQENIDYTIFRIIAYKGTTLNNQTIYYQILDTSVNDLTYEQYGASPSPDYKSEIESVGSNVNEFDIAAVKDGFLNEKTGEIISNNSWKCSDFIEILNKTYTFGWESSSDYFQVTVCYYDENKKFISGKSYGLRGTFNNTFEIVSNAKYMKIAYSVSVSGESVTREKIKLEKGTVATPWSQHGQGCVKVTKCNKNLFDKDKALQKYELNRTTGQIKSNGLFFTSDYIRVSPNKQYFLSGKNDGESNCFYDKNKKYIDAVVLKNGLLTVPDNSNIYYLRLNSRLTAIDTTMLEKNTKKSAYEEHQGQSYIMPTQTEMLENDYLDYDNEEEVHVWGKKILDGTEEINLQWDVSDKHGYRIAIDNIKKTTSSADKSLIISNSYKAYIQDDLFNLKYKAYGISNRYNNSEVIIRNDDITTVTAFKAYLKSQYDAGTPVIIYYQLATPKRLKFTDEQKSVAKELNNARTYKNVTNITTDSKAILSLDYAKDQETQNQKMQNEIDEIKQLLSTTQTSAMLLDNLQTDIESEVK